MMRMDLIAIALSVTLISCNGQTSRQKGESVSSSANPQTNIKVDKQYDSSGNLIKYDSTYSYYYSNVRNNNNLKDSIFKDFKNHFSQKYSFSGDRFFNDLFFQDSLLKYDFYRKDFFMKRFRNNMRMIDSLFWGMDSLKNSYFNKQFVLPGPVKTPIIK